MTKMIAPIKLDTANTQIQIERNVIAYSQRKSPLKLLRDVVASIGLLGWLAPPTDDPFGKPCRARTRDRATYQSQRSEVLHLLPLPLSQ